LDGVLRGIASAKDEIFVFADNPFRKEQSIYELDKDLNEMKIRINKQTAFHTDSLYFNGKFLIINNAKNDYSGPTNKIFLLENQNASMNIINLTENAPYQIFRNNDNIVVAHYDFPTRSGKKVTVWDNELNFKKGYELKNNLYLSHMNDNIFYSLDVDYDLYQYDSNDFTLLSINRLKKINGMVISDFFVFDQ
ncbi:hypothetical protein, partial [Tepidibacillus decaturensis]|uniref:hypothetical protein n=1 Tax=Tepidibacillus decaturensis TaxID=1413211 RepID=UPI00190FFE21